MASPPFSVGAGEPEVSDTTRETFRQRMRRMMRPPRRLAFTRAGKFFMLLTLAVGAGALNTGNNLLFLLLGMMLSAIIASGLLSEAVLRKLWLERRAPSRIFANRAAAGSFKLNNPRNYLSINIEISERNATCEVGPIAGEEIGHKDVPAFKFWVEDSFDGDDYVAIARMPELGAGETKHIQALYNFPFRGRYKSPGMRLATRFPFGIFHKIVEVDQERDFVVFPEPAPADDWAADVAARFGDIARNRAGNGEEYFGLRDWREGEDRRQIHWKSSARRGAFVVRESEEQEQRAVEIVLLHATGHKSQAPPYMKDAFEEGLRKTVGLLEELVAKRYRVALRTLDGATDAGEGITHLDRMLHQLATLELHEGNPTALPATRVSSGGPMRNDVARVGIGFGSALDQCPETFDLALVVDQPKEEG
jgi:uncharacterized protein (DUF58 family)